MHSRTKAAVTMAAVTIAIPLALPHAATSHAAVVTRAVGSRTQQAAVTDASLAQHQLVPAYFFPHGNDTTNPWHIMCRRLNKVGGPSTAILNPSSGPGTEAIAAYTEVIAYCHTRGHRVIGYVDTGYGGRPLRQVFADVDAFYRLYPAVDGIFLDQMRNCPGCSSIEPGTSIKSYYRQIYLHIKSKTSAHSDVVGNPGAAADTGWQVDTPVATTVVVFEGGQASYATWSPPAWVLSRPAARLAHLVHTATATQRHDACERSRSLNAGWVYVTDDVMRNPWDRLPTYWNSVAPTCG
jgi:Spherulation-specific family 4